MRLGVDDTDSPGGMCTTSLVPRLARLAARRGLDLLGPPRLVRLNPNVPWKTRGNGAVALALGDGAGEPFRIGHADGEPLRAYPAGVEAPLDGVLFEEACALVEAAAHLHHPDTHPGVVAWHGEPPFGFTRRAVQELVEPSEARRVLGAADAEGAAARGWKSGRGLIGALAACGWDAERAGDVTFEALAYRSPDAIGSPRRLDAGRALRLEAAYPTTFDNVDPVHGVLRVAPHGPDPVLWGVRADEPGDALGGCASLGPEPAAATLLFQTNQATDGHLQRARFGDATPFRSVAVEGVVASLPRTVRGGHTFVRLREDGGEGHLTLAAYEPTKGLRAAVRALRPGDRVEAHGGVGRRGQVSLEKFRVLAVAEARVKVANPRCACGKAMKSRGREGGYRCPRCRREAPASAATWASEPRTLRPGWFEACVCARRHLAKPLRRLAAPPPALALPLLAETL